MKYNFVRCLIFTAFMLVLTGMPFQFLHIDSVKSAYAMGSISHLFFYGKGNGNGNGNAHSVPEPTTLSLLAVSAVGIGIFSFIRRRNRK